MKYFYLSLFLFVFTISGFSQALLNSTGNTSVTLQNSMLFNPNPATNFVRIGYSLVTCSKVSLSVYNQIGQEVLSVIKEYQKEGNYYFDADISKLLPGIYFVRLNAGKEIITKKLLVN